MGISNFDKSFDQIDLYFQTCIGILYTIISNLKLNYSAIYYENMSFSQAPKVPVSRRCDVYERHLANENV